VQGCAGDVPAPLNLELLCLDHYIEQAFSRLQDALELCQECRAVDAHALDWLLGDADFAVQALAQDGRSHTSAQRDKLLELLLNLSNLHEYLRHHSVTARLAD
jgi:hypothetical protein